MSSKTSSTSASGTPLVAVVLIILAGIALTTAFYFFFLQREQLAASQSAHQSSLSSVPITNSAAPRALPPSKQKDANAVSGRWLGHLQSGRTDIAISFTLLVAASRLSGTAEFPIGSGPIDGSINGDRVEFVAVHHHQGKKLRTTFSGTINAYEGSLVMTTEGVPIPLVISKQAKMTMPF